MQEHARILERGAPDPASISGEDARPLIAARPADRRSVRAVQRGGAEGIRTPDPFHAITVRRTVSEGVVRDRVRNGWPPAARVQGGCYRFRYTWLRKKWSVATAAQAGNPVIRRGAGCLYGQSVQSSA